MSEEIPNQDFVENLLSRDPEVAATNFEEFRMNLEYKLSQIEHRSRAIRRATFIGMGLTISIYACILLLELYNLVDHEWVRFAWATCCYIALIVTGILATMNQYKYLPAIKRTRFDLQTAMIEDLQRQVAELSRRLDERSR